MPSHQHSQPSPQAPSVGLSQSSSTKRMSWIFGIDADRVERFQIELLQVVRRRLEDHLELVIVLQPVRVFAVAAVLGPARGLHIGGVPRLRPERAQRGRRMEGAGADLHVVGLQDDAALVRPIALQRQDQALERALGTHMGRQQVLVHGTLLVERPPAVKPAPSSGGIRPIADRVSTSAASRGRPDRRGCRARRRDRR